MTTDPIDLDAIEARAKDASAAIFAGDWFVVQRGAAARLAREDVPALLVEVRRLRAGVGALADEKPGATGRALRAILDPGTHEAPPPTS